MVETLQDFIRQWGAPSGLLSDSAKVETSKVVKDVLCMYGIKDMQSEPNHQHQNYAERRDQEVKATPLTKRVLPSLASSDFAEEGPGRTRRTYTEPRQARPPIVAGINRNADRDDGNRCNTSRHAD